MRILVSWSLESYEFCLPSFEFGTFQMLVDDIGDVTITNDGATILKMLEVEHPAAKVNANLFTLYFHYCLI